MLSVTFFFRNVNTNLLHNVISFPTIYFVSEQSSIRTMFYLISDGIFCNVRCCRNKYTCIASALIISPLKWRQSSRDNFVLPVPVAPRTTTTGFLKEVAMLANLPNCVSMSKPLSKYLIVIVRLCVPRVHFPVFRLHTHSLENIQFP